MGFGLGKRAARDQGFPDADHYWQWLADYVVHRRIPT
jgi:hypothetical protein